MRRAVCLLFLLSFVCARRSADSANPPQLAQQRRLAHLQRRLPPSPAPPPPVKVEHSVCQKIVTPMMPYYVATHYLGWEVACNKLRAVSATPLFAFDMAQYITNTTLHQDYCLQSRNSSSLTRQQLAEVARGIKTLPAGAVLHVQVPPSSTSPARRRCPCALTGFAALALR